MKNKVILMTVVCISIMQLAAMPVFAQAPVQSPDLSALMAKLDKLEKDNEALRGEMADLKKSVASIKAPSDAQIVQPKTDAKAGGVLSSVQGAIENVKSKLPMEIYGTAYLDTMYNDFNGAEYPYYVPNGAANNNKGEFLMSARGTRFGMNINGPEIPLGTGGKLAGKVEMDFLGAPGSGSADTTSNPQLRLRLAYLDVIYPDWDLRVGQDWDFFAPLNPNTMNPYILWNQGNLGIRHVQLKMSKKWTNIYDGTVKVSVGAIEGSDPDDLQIKSQMPLFAAFVSYERPIYDMPFFIGTGTVLGQQNASSAVTKRVPIWGQTISAKLSPHKKVDLMAEGYYGAGLGTFQSSNNISAVTPSYNIDGEPKAIRSQGGFFTVTLKPYAKIKICGGAGIDSTSSESGYGYGVTATGGSWPWQYNYTYFTNIQYSLTSNCIVGLEFQRLGTKYWETRNLSSSTVTSGTSGGEGNRVMTSVIYYF